jgi:hypothetical protein
MKKSITIKDASIMGVNIEKTSNANELKITWILSGKQTKWTRLLDVLHGMRSRISRWVLK